ncbi:hypothetical protein TIFTF001_010916 [Ficus carica]|uniref:Uncharacterized protein n=1 Tax=Ficus carica TaxID=3494 RepID=A0AA87ZYY6_FICCA|nr:hypothetical protein TIFTF001_010916 [Ficus carica]
MCVRPLDQMSFAENRDSRPGSIVSSGTSRRHPPPPTLTGPAPAGAGDNNPTAPCSGLGTRGATPLVRLYLQA